MSKIIAQIIIQGTAILSRAFVSAYQQALANARVGGAANAANMAKSVGKLKMQPDEALKILNIDKTVPLSKDLIEKRYEEQSAKNNPDNGGSFYLKSKIFRAKEALEKEIGKGEENKEEKVDENKSSSGSAA